MMIMKNTKQPRTLLENLEANRLSGVEPLSAEQIAGTIFDCTLNFVQTFEDRDASENQEMMGRIVIAGQMAIEKTINSEPNTETMGIHTPDNTTKIANFLIQKGFEVEDYSWKHDEVDKLCVDKNHLVMMNDHRFPNFQIIPYDPLTEDRDYDEMETTCKTPGDILNFFNKL